MSSKRIYIAIQLNVGAYKENDAERYTREWIEYRINIFMNYTLKSLKAQTNQDFVATVRYEDSTEDIIKEILPKYEKLPGNVKFIRKSSFGSDVIREIQGYDYLYMVRLDSDDMYHISYIQQLHEYEPKEGTVILINQKGYIYDSNLNQLAKYYNDSPPFFTVIYKTADYLSGVRHQIVGGHPGAIKLPHEIIAKTNYMFHSHQLNTTMKTSYFSERYKDTLITDLLKVKEILKEFIGSNEK